MQIGNTGLMTFEVQRNTTRITVETVIKIGGEPERLEMSYDGGRFVPKEVHLHYSWVDDEGRWAWVASLFSGDIDVYCTSISGTYEVAGVQVPVPSWLIRLAEELTPLPPQPTAYRPVFDLGQSRYLHPITGEEDEQCAARRGIELSSPANREA